MFSALIPNLDSEPALARTLSSLVSASAEGVLKEVVIADLGSSDDSRMIAEATGAKWCACDNAEPNPLSSALHQCARAQWLLLIRPGWYLKEGWQTEAAAFAEKAQAGSNKPQTLARFSYATNDFGKRSRLHEAWTNIKHALVKSSGHQMPLVLHKHHMAEILKERVLHSVEHEVQHLLRRSSIIALKSSASFDHKDTP